MGVKSFARSVYNKVTGKSNVEKQGTIYLKPSESSQAASIAKKTGATVEIPETGQTYVPSTGGFVSSGGGGGGMASVPSANIQAELSKIESKLPQQSITQQQIATLKSQGLTPSQIAVAKRQGITPSQIAVAQSYQQTQKKDIFIQPPTAEQRARIETAGTTRIYQPQVSEGQRQEMQFQRGQVSAQNLLFGCGGTSEMTPVELREERLRQPVRQQLTTAYKSGGKGVRGGLRAGIVGLDILGSKTIEPVLKKLKIPQVVISTKPLEEVGMFSLFLSPVSSTTAQLEKEVFELSRVKLIGVQQQVTSKKAISQAGFEVYRGNKYVKGVVTAKSLSQNIPSKVDLLTKQGVISVTKQNKGVITSAMGKTFNRGINIPTGTDYIKTGKVFKSIEVSRIAEKNNLFLSKGFGFSRVASKEKTPFISYSIGKQKGSYIRQVGYTATKKGDSISLGLFKILKSGSEKIYKLKKTSPSKLNLKSIEQVNKNILSIVNRNTLSSAVKSSVIIPARQPINVLPTIVSAKSFIQPKTISDSSSNLPRMVGGLGDIFSEYSGKNLYELTEGGMFPSSRMQSLFEKPTTQSLFAQPFVTNKLIDLKTTQKMGAVSISKQEQINPLKEIQKHITKQIQNTVQINISELKTKTILKQRQVQKQVPLLRQKQVNRLFIPKVPTPTIKPKESFIFPKLKPYKQPKLYSGGFGVYGRRWSKFKLVGIGKTPLEAVGIGKIWATKTLGVTFKVPAYKGTKVKGFRTKKEKEGLVFIEPEVRRLKRGTKEIPEIQYWRKLKGGGI